MLHCRSQILQHHKLFHFTSFYFHPSIWMAINDNDDIYYSHKLRMKCNILPIISMSRRKLKSKCLQSQHFTRRDVRQPEEHDRLWEYARETHFSMKMWKMVHFEHERRKFLNKFQHNFELFLRWESYFNSFFFPSDYVISECIIEFVIMQLSLILYEGKNKEDLWKVSYFGELFSLSLGILATWTLIRFNGLRMVLILRN